MRKVLVTGAKGFIGKNLCLALRRSEQADVMEIGSNHAESDLMQAVSEADVVVHLAGVNRPEKEEDFITGNTDYTKMLCDLLETTGRQIPVIYSSSIQAEKDNAYGESKRLAEQVVLEYQNRTQSDVFVFRLPNVFGKWSKPEYNTVVATFCHHISRGISVQMNDRDALLNFAYIDDVVACFSELIFHSGKKTGLREFDPVHRITLGDLHDLLVSFKESRKNLLLADFGDPLVKYLYSTYLSFLDRGDYSYPVDLKEDDRGWLFELLKSKSAGQIFVSSTKPGITRGNHYHDTKVEKFCVLKGQGLIKFRHVLEDEVFEYSVNDHNIEIVDIPPGYTHSITNTGDDEMVTLFWANEIFDPEKADTSFEEV